MTSDRPRIIVARHRWPLNQHPSDLTPDYYSNLEKPVYAWTMDDVLEYAISTPAIRLDVQECVQFLNDLHPTRQRGLDRIVSYCAVDFIPMLSKAVTPFANRILTLLDMLSKKGLGLPPDDAPGLKIHPEHDPEKFPLAGPQDSCVLLYKPIWHFGIENVLRRAEDHDPLCMKDVRRYLAELTEWERVRFDRMVDMVALSLEPQLHQPLGQFSDRICHFFNEGMEAANHGR